MTEPPTSDDLFVDLGNQFYLEVDPDNDFVVICDSIVLDDERAAQLRDWLNTWLENR